MELILHIGQSKTGTSAIQHFLAMNRERLAAKGILYPAAEVSGNIVNIKNHNAFADSIQGRLIFPFLRYEEYINYFKKVSEDKRYSKIILSAEHFFGGEPRIWDCSDESDYFRKYREKVSGLKEVASGKSVHIVTYLRPQVDWFCSAVSQTVRVEPLIKRGQLYKNDSSFLKLVSPLLRYDVLMGIWKEVFPEAKFTIVPYIRSELINNNIVDDFFHHISIDSTNFDGKEITKEVNTSFSLEFIEVKKVLNLENPDRFRERAIIKCLLKLSEKSTFGRNYVPDNGIVQQIHDMCRGVNSALSNEYMPAGTVLPVASKSAMARGGRPNEADIAKAMEIFRREFRKPTYRLLKVNIAVKAILRERFPLIHAKLHTVKHRLFA